MKRLTVTAIALMIFFITPAHGTWTVQYTGSRALDCVFFVDSLYGWAGGGSNNHGMILKTTDGGANWSTALDDTQSVFMGIWFIDRQTGWAVGGRDNYTVIDSTCQKILKTTDGGSTWRRQWNRNSNTNWRNLYGVCFIGSTGWACVCGWSDSIGYIIKTTDAGENWFNQAALPGKSDPMDVQFSDVNHGVVCGGYNWGNPADNTDGIISTTTNGGATWSTPYTWRPGTLAMGYFWDVTVVNQAYAWCAGSAVGPSVNEPGRIASTYNGGVNWVLRNSSPLYLYTGIYFPDTSWGWVGSAYGNILMTTDGGHNWADDNSCVYDFITDIFGVSRRYVWAVDDGGAIIKYEPVTGIDDRNAGEAAPGGIIVTPNPFVSFASVPGAENESFALYDLSGRRAGIFRGDRIGQGLSPGVYYLIGKEPGSAPVRIVKVR